LLVLIREGVVVLNGDAALSVLVISPTKFAEDGWDEGSSQTGNTWSELLEDGANGGLLLFVVELQVSEATAHKLLHKFYIALLVYRSHAIDGGLLSDGWNSSGVSGLDASGGDDGESWSEEHVDKVALRVEAV